MPTSAINIDHIKSLLATSRFGDIFIEELGWSRPATRSEPPVTADGQTYRLTHIAQLSGIAAIEVASPDGAVPNAARRAAVHREVAKRIHEHILIFVDKDRALSDWYWVKRDGSRRLPRDHFYAKGQPGDLFVSKIAAMAVDISELDTEGRIALVEVARRVKDALDVEQVSKRFYEQYRERRLDFIGRIGGIPDDKERRWYASVLLNRLMFIYFLQKKGFLGGQDFDYLQNKLAESAGRGQDRYYSEFLQALFFEGFAKPAEKRSPAARALIGEVRYLNGGLFLPHQVEEKYRGQIRVPDSAFRDILDLFHRYSWNLDDAPGGKADEISPHVLGYIFERYINDKSFGAYYTRPEITNYLCERTIYPLILDRVNDVFDRQVAPDRPRRRFDEIEDIYRNLDADLCSHLVSNVLPTISILDPACGSGAFLVAAMTTMLEIYGAIIGRLHVINDRRLNAWFESVRKDRRSTNYHLKRKIITENIFGVDIIPEAAEIARLRLFLALVSSAKTIDELEPLPNIDFNILHGNSLIGLLSIRDLQSKEQIGFGAEHFIREVEDRNRQIAIYRQSDTYRDNLVGLRDDIEKVRRRHYDELNRVLLDEQFKGIKYEQATWDEAKQTEGKPKKRPLTPPDIEALDPFHWGYDLDPVMNKRGGFDVIITNPPWDIFKPNSKEYLRSYSAEITINKMTIKEFEEQKGQLLADPVVCADWLAYLSRFPHVSAFYRSAAQYENQISVANGKRAGTDINLYKLFTEQCFNLLRKGGQCGMVIPSGIYTDLGTKQLREMLFTETQISGLFGFENRQAGRGVIFDNVDSRFKFVVLTYDKSGHTEQFPAAFMRHDVRELDEFPERGSLLIETELVRRLSPDSLSIMEFKDVIDVQIAEKMLEKFPLLGERIEGTWNLVLGNEFHMTNDSHLFKTSPGPGRLPLYEGKMIHQFRSDWGRPKYWIEEADGRRDIGGKSLDSEGRVNYERYRTAHREIARNTDERTVIAAILPRGTFANHKLHVSRDVLGGTELCLVCALMNSFVYDFWIRMGVTSSITMFFTYQVPAPRLTERDPQFRPIVERAAKLVCTTPEFDDLAREVGLRGHEDGVTDPAERAKLRAELDGIIAHLYGLTEDEFAHILTTFPLVAQSIKDAAMEEFKRQAPKAGDTEIAALIAKGESASLEFKSSARWDMVNNVPNKAMEKVIVKTVAGFLNSQDGGTLLIGVDDGGKVIGLAHDYQTLKKKDQDGYELWLHDLLLNACGKDAVLCVRVSFHEHHGCDICRIDISPSSKQVWVRDEGADHFYIRAGNSTRELTGREPSDYIQSRWP